MPRLRTLSGALLAAALLCAGARADKRLLGFGEAASRAQRDLESRFDALVAPTNLRTWMERLAARPHHTGSPYGRENAEFLAGLFRSWGFETRIETFHVLFPSPRRRHLELVAPARFVASLNEPPLVEDGTSGRYRDEQLPLYNAYSVDGDVTGELVYVNYGVPEDYDELARRGIDVAGRIVIARYGGAWRGVKPKVAAERGAVGCLIYSDPREDGYFQGHVYPRGGWRNERSGQRGSVLDFTAYEGDPLTPLRGATEDADRVAREDSPSLTRIPTLPISWSDALPLLGALGGPVAPEAWRGALPIPYYLGPGPAKVRLEVGFDWSLAPVHDVIAVLPGSERPDQWVLRGNHHDAWVYGASDPVSGLVTLLEEARVVSELVKGGWRPRRTLVYAAWDGEEQGLMGSTEWVETHAEELRRKAVAYLNTDGYERGFFSAGGSQTLEHFLNQVARDVDDPAKGVSLRERARAQLILEGEAEMRREAEEREDLRLPPLGSGSDYGPFLQFLGIASLNLGFGGEGQYGQYHSLYDSFDHFLRFADPDFSYGATLVKAAGRATLRLAQAEVLPFEFMAIGDGLGRFVAELIELADSKREATEQRNRWIEDGVYEAFFDPREPFVAPPLEEPVPHLNFAPLENALLRVQKAAVEYRLAYKALTDAGEAVPLETQLALDAVLMEAERALTRQEGLPGRPWFRHQVYAPGVYTGYEPKTVPGVREAIEGRRWREAEEQIEVVSGVFEAFAAQIAKATALLPEPPDDGVTSADPADGLE